MKRRAGHALVNPASVQAERHYALLEFACFLLITAFSISLLARPVYGEELDLSNFVPTFVENFETLDISAYGPGTRWIAHTPWNGDFGDAIFANPGPDGPFALTPEGLTITASKRADGRWQGGLICSMDKDGSGQQGFAQQFGYFEMRARLPDGPGVWPAFWLIGIDKKTSASEIDVLEYYGQFSEYYHNWAHIFQGGQDRLLKNNLVHVPAGSLTDRFNDFGVLVEPESTRFFLNRKEIWRLPTPPEYHQPFYVLANLALGGGWPIDKLQSPAVMTIAHIMVFQDKARLPTQTGAAASGNAETNRTDSLRPGGPATEGGGG